MVPVCRSPASAAKRAHLARPALYERLRRTEEVLGVSLNSAQSRTSLHVAALALGALARRESAS
jgi:purine catabolism regulator